MTKKPCIFQDIEVGESEGRSQPFVISGYSVLGSVVTRFRSSDSTDLSGVEVGLFSANSKAAVTQTKTDAAGTYKFSKVPVGNYVVRWVKSATFVTQNSLCDLNFQFQG